MHDWLDRARWIETEAWTDIAGGAPEPLRRVLGVDVVRWDGTTLLRAERLESILFNRVLGLETADDEEVVLARALERFAQARVTRFFVQAPHADAHWAALMQRHALVGFHRPWVKLARGRGGPVVRERCVHEIGAARPGEASAWAQVLAEGLDIDAAGIPLLAAVVGRPGWVTLVTRDAEEVVGSAAMFVRDGVASLTGAATRPTHRRRGIQMALLARRVAMALDAGCSLITSETGIEVPGQRNSSCNNMIRCGLEIVGTVDNYTRPETRWAR
jgi:GNAT superfamily N-acetyltransferase